MGNMIMFTVILGKMDMEMAFSEAKKDAFGHYFRSGFSVTLLNITMQVNEGETLYLFNFQAEM